jgi:hypothetical protein
MVGIIRQNHFVTNFPLPPSFAARRNWQNVSNVKILGFLDSYKIFTTKIF